MINSVQNPTARVMEAMHGGNSVEVDSAIAFSVTRGVEVFTRTIREAARL